MATDRILKNEHLAAFRRDGYVYLPKFFKESESRRIAGWAETVRTWPEEAGKHMVYYEDCLNEKNGRIVNRIENLTPFHAGFRSLFTSGPLIDAASELLNERAILFKDKINFKLPGGEGFKAHQDAQAGWHAYAAYFVSVLVSIDKSTEENGCLELAPGWHKRGLIGQEWTPLDEASMSEMQFVSCPTEPGDVMFFDCFAPHRSGRNLAKDPRRILYVTYNRVSEGDHRVAYFADKRRDFPPDVEREPGETYVFRV